MLAASFWRVLENSLSVTWPLPSESKALNIWVASSLTLLDEDVAVLLLLLPLAFCIAAWRSLTSR